MKLLSLLLVTVALTGVACERHEFDGPAGTKQLHEHSASHDHEAAPADKPAH